MHGNFIEKAMVDILIYLSTRHELLPDVVFALVGAVLRVEGVIVVVVAAAAPLPVARPLLA